MAFTHTLAVQSIMIYAGHTRALWSVKLWAFEVWQWQNVFCMQVSSKITGPGWGRFSRSLYQRTNVGCCKEDDIFFFALRSVLHPHPPRSEPSACPWWHAGTLAVWVWVSKEGQGHEQQDLHCPSLCLFLLSPPCSLLQFPRCPGYLCHGNCASLPAQTQIPPLVSLFASMMTQQLLQGISLLPPQPRWYTLLIRQSSVLSSSSLADLNTKQTQIIKRPTRLICVLYHF